ncbi:transporter [Streptomyces sp. SCA2-2]|uniref:transporter n=1 Tax=Streptomyces sp. SCA2-2 TaxID=1563677 RepID=UPI00101F7195|nr:transporter [Streptomyces sp. SCA2-2]RZE99994.1 transporter [Streptomyces sp. SCA2-2]
MSTATLERESATDRDPGPRRLLHGMTWLVWRQHRGALWTGLALVAALVVAAVLLRNAAVAHQAAHGIAGCPLMGGPERCSSRLEVIEEYRGLYSTPLRLLLAGILALPFLGGLFVGAPLIARELEADTHRLVWAQGITRERWLLHKLALPMGAMVAGTGVAAWFGSWALEGAGQATIGLYWYSPTAFVSTGPAVLGYAALGVALGAMAGTLTRRTLPAMVLTLGAMGAVTALLTTIRSHVVSPVVSFGRSVPQLREEDWVLVQPQAARADRTIFDAGPCYPADDFDACLADNGASWEYSEHHPIGHMRDLQLAEGALCLGLAALAVTFVWLWMRRRAF